jgi:hypothetical protein
VYDHDYEEEQREGAIKTTRRMNEYERQRVGEHHQASLGTIGTSSTWIYHRSGFQSIKSRIFSEEKRKTWLVTFFISFQ